MYTFVSIMLGNLLSWAKLTGHEALIKTKRRFYVFRAVRRRHRYEERQTDGETDGYADTLMDVI